MYYWRHFHMSNCSFIFRMIFIFLDIILRNIKNTSTKRGLVNHYRDKWSNEWFELLSNVLRELNLPERVIITRSKSLTSMKRKYKGETSNWKSNKTCNKLAVFSKHFGYYYNGITHLETIRSIIFSWINLNLVSFYNLTVILIRTIII